MTRTFFTGCHARQLACAVGWAGRDIHFGASLFPISQPGVCILAWYHPLVDVVAVLVDQVDDAAQILGEGGCQIKVRPNLEKDDLE